MRVPELSAGSGKRKDSLKIQVQNSAAGTCSLGAEGNPSWRCPTGSVSYMDEEEMETGKMPPTGGT